MSGRWALVAISFILRFLAILTLLGWAVGLVIAIFSGAFTNPIRVGQSTGDPQLDAMILNSAALWVYGFTCLVVFGIPLLALGLYALAQWINLHIDLEANTRALRNVRRRE